jgi:class 3 adenylate cyclase
VLSSAARAALADSIAEGVELRSLGSWRFQGLREPHELFQVEVDGLAATFPPLRAGVKV